MPRRSVDEGTSRSCGSWRRVIVSSRLKKKNTRFFWMGPPNEPPKMLRINFGLSIVFPVRELIVELLKKLFADVTVLRRYS
jgi:hypothetical protein